MRSAQPNRSAVQRIAEIDRLIHEPARLLLVSCLYVVEAADFVFLSRQTGLTGGNLSSHMSKLEEAGYLIVEKSFVGKRPRTMLRLTLRGRAAFEGYRRAIGAVLDGSPEAATDD